MRWTRSFGIALAGAACLAAPAAAQLARVQASPNAPKLLVAPFGRLQAQDSDLAMTVGDGLRERMRIDHTDDFQTVQKKAMCDILTESGFACTTGLEQTVIAQLARFANARYVVDGMLYPRGGDSVLILARLVQAVGTSPLSATASVVLAKARVTGSTGSQLADRLADKFRAFEQVTNCRNARDQKNYARALDAASRALRYDPQSGGALLCTALVMQDQGASTDSVQVVFERAHDADSMNSVVARQLARIYQEKGDTLQLLHMLHHILQVDVADNELRIETARLFVARHFPDSAVMLLDQGLARNPNQFDLVQAKAISFAAAEKWDSAAANMRSAADIDSTKIDSLFFERIIAFYDAAHDTVHVLNWERRMTEHVPGYTANWYRYGTGLLAHGDTTGAQAAIKQFMTLAPGDGRGHLVYATLLLAQAARDTANHALNDSALAHARMAGEADSSYRPGVAPIFLRLGAQALQPPPNYLRADSLLTLAKEWSGPQTAPTAGFYLGVAQFQLGLAAVQEAGRRQGPRVPPAVRDSACALVRSATDYLNLSEPNVSANASVNRELANSLLTYMPQLRGALPQLNRAFKCPS
jgi:tetratricopeptide (TPR) repeat protein/TolB-like protein